MKLYKFNELSQEIQIDIIKGKLLDFYRQGLIRELAIDILYKQNNTVYQCQNELYDIDGNFIKEMQ